MPYGRRLFSTLLRLQALIAAGLVTPLAPADELSITVANIGSSSGHILLAVVDGRAAFDGGAASVLSVRLPPGNGTVRFSTDALGAGEYGVRVLHDENGNGELDSNLVGMPTEPWGFSNNATGNFGPPGWDDVRFRLDGHADLTIHLNH